MAGKGDGNRVRDYQKFRTCKLWENIGPDKIGSPPTKDVATKTAQEGEMPTCIEDKVYKELLNSGN